MSFSQIKELASNNEKQTPLILAASNNSYDIFMYLLTELNCNITAIDSKKNNILHYAIMNNNLDMLIKIVLLDSDECLLR